MNRLPACRLLLETEPNTGAWNMAVDEVLLETAVTDGLATFRWYRWSEPTLSLGYFQDESEIAGERQWAALPRVRRLTGGGAILHDREWTYSLAVPARQELYRHPEELYDVVHAAIIDVLQRLGCPVGTRGATVKQSPEPVLCFSRRDAHDVVWRDAKILGSAQRRRKGAVLQHGSLLLEHSALTPQHRGIHNLGFHGTLQVDELRQVPERIADGLFAAPLTPGERQQVGRKSPKDRRESGPSFG